MAVLDNLGLIVAIGENNEIGYQNNLIWRIKEDLNYFKNVTMNSYIIMGRVTYESMPKNLEGRKYIVLTKNANLKIPNSLVFHNPSEVIEFVKKNRDSEFWVVGGAKIYALFMPYVKVMHITRIMADYKDATAYFPLINECEWNIASSKQCECDNLVYYHEVYEK